MRLATAAGLAGDGKAVSGTRHRPTLISLRHTFTVTTLIGWLSDGINVEPNLPVLSTWLGHKDPRSTYWYIETIPELLQAASDYALRASNDGASPRSTLPWPGGCPHGDDQQHPPTPTPERTRDERLLRDVRCVHDGVIDDGVDGHAKASPQWV
ncbi:hypothetical protein [Nonomuraea sp. NPDC049141]|uniref:hypothetical protein n=1 Tax=Nonomuraea sp. NPDC049141 TaxID=3155500 RepID=UPI0033DF1450